MGTAPGVFTDQGDQGGWPRLSRRPAEAKVRETPSCDGIRPGLEKDREAAASRRDCKGLGPVESYLRHVFLKKHLNGVCYMLNTVKHFTNSNSFNPENRGRKRYTESHIAGSGRCLHQGSRRRSGKGKSHSGYLLVAWWWA